MQRTRTRSPTTGARTTRGAVTPLLQGVGMECIIFIRPTAAAAFGQLSRSRGAGGHAAPMRHACVLKSGGLHAMH